MIPHGAERQREAHIWARDGGDHYVEPLWVSARLFDEVSFTDSIWDPACGFGRIPANAYRHGYRNILQSDIVERGKNFHGWLADFFKVAPAASTPENIICNPPFDQFKEFAMRALYMARGKVAMIWTVRTLPAARWLESTPLKKVLLLTPRPSMPPGRTIEAGQKPGGGTADYCWLVWEVGFGGVPTMAWLKRDGNVAAGRPVIQTEQDPTSNS